VYSTDDRRTVRFWRPNTSAVTGMLRVEREDERRIVGVTPGAYARSFVPFATNLPTSPKANKHPRRTVTA
jgi:hypothetical protein